MEELTSLSNQHCHQLLDYLYKDEALNISMIHSIEMKMADNSKFYVKYLADKVQGILHVRPDGDTKITQFYTHSKEGLKAIAHQISKLKKGDNMIVGREDDVRFIGECMSLDKGIFFNHYFKLNKNKFIFEGFHEDYSLYQLDDNVDDCRSIYDLVYREASIGEAGFSCWSQNYVEIDGFSLDANYQNIGHEKEFLKILVKKALAKGRVPIIMVSPVNIKARKIYEELGFEQFCNYTFRML